MAVDWDSAREGDELPELVKRPDLRQLVQYAAGSGDFNPLHYDYRFPQAQQIGSVIVHGRFKYAALGELVSNWLGHGGRVRKLACQYRGMDLPEQDILCRGRVVAKHETDGQRTIELEVWTENGDGKRTTPGTAVVVLDDP